MLEFVFVRNARREEDRDTLSREGEARCLRAGGILGDLGFRPDLVVTSDEPRSKRTGELIAQGLGGIQPRFVEVLCLQYLAPSWDAWEQIAPIFQELGIERPMTEYLAKDTGDILLGHARDVVNRVLSEADKGPDTVKVLIIGSHIIQNLVGIAYAGQNPILLGPHFPPLTGYWVHQDKSVTEVQLID